MRTHTPKSYNQSFCKLQLVLGQACKSSHYPQNMYNVEVTQWKTTYFPGLQIHWMWSHLWGNSAIPFQSFASLLANNRAANFCQLWEILRYEYLSIGMWNENTKGWCFKKLYFEGKEKNTRGNLLNIRLKRNQANFLKLVLWKWLAFWALYLIYCSQNLSYPILLWQSV